MCIVTKFEIQTYFTKIHLKITNFICICTRGQKLDFCLLVHMHMQMKFVIFLWIFAK
jgi:hypothetical protein